MQGSFEHEICCAFHFVLSLFTGQNERGELELCGYPCVQELLHGAGEGNGSHVIHIAFSTKHVFSFIHDDKADPAPSLEVALPSVATLLSCEDTG